MYRKWYLEQCCAYSDLKLDFMQRFDTKSILNLHLFKDHNPYSHPLVVDLKLIFRIPAH